MGVAGDGLGVEVRRIDVHALPRLDQVDHDQAQRQREGGQHLEVDQRAHAHAPQFLHVLHARDAERDGREDDGREHHLDELDEHVAERLEIAAEVGRRHPQHDPRRNADQDLHVQFAERLADHGCLL